MTGDIPPSSRSEVQELGLSRIREVANAGFGRADIQRFWFGESDRVTPDYIRERAIAAIRDGKTFYSHNNGAAELREAISAYLRGLHGKPFDTSRITVTSSGVSALMIAMQALLDPGDTVTIVTPVWPNVTEMPRILGARVDRVTLSPTPSGWKLDLDRLISRITPETRLLILNSPGNPTGWMIPAEDQKVLLSHCRRLGVWVLCDDVYERLVFDPASRVAPSFLRLADPQDRVIGVNSFSKAWLMTGWRLGWLVAPSGMETDLGKLIEYNTSCTPEFIQASGVTALVEGEPHVAALRKSLAGASAFMTDQLARIEGVNMTPAAGGMYVMLRLAGEPDAVSLCKRLVHEARLGLAPGEAFGPESAGWIRWCIATDNERLGLGVARLADWIVRTR